MDEALPLATMVPNSKPSKEEQALAEELARDAERHRWLFHRPDDAPQLMALEPDAYQTNVFGFVLDQDLDADWWISATVVRDGPQLVIGRLTIEPNIYKHDDRPPPGGIGSAEVRGVRVGEVLARALGQAEAAPNRRRATRQLLPELAEHFTELGLGEEEVKLAREAAEEAVQGRPKPGRPPKPDSFYEQLAREYLELQAQEGRSRGIQPQLADRHGYSREAVRDWVREARRRGFLAPARKGQAGARAGPQLPALPAQGEETEAVTRRRRK